MARKIKRMRCVTGKRRFLTKAEADKFIESTNNGPAIFLLGYRLERSYQCTKCRGGWHCTTETLEQYEANLELHEELSSKAWRSLETIYSESSIG